MMSRVSTSWIEGTYDLEPSGTDGSMDGRTTMCVPGTEAISGGYRFASAHVTVYESRRIVETDPADGSPIRSGWHVEFRNDSPQSQGGAYRLEVYCAVP